VIQHQLAPWQVWLVDFGNPIGHEEGGVRPAVVVGSTTHCRFPIGMAIVVPLTLQRSPHSASAAKSRWERPRQPRSRGCASGSGKWSRSYPD
jgi:mRNA-degrading endonuclease toxin of MazEF toxin-antitoxin module